MSSPAAQAAQLALVVKTVKQVFGTCFIGFTIATTLYGITVLQTYMYYRTFPKDSKGTKAIVALLVLLDSLTTIFVAHSLYTFFVLNYNLNPKVNLVIPWSFNAEKLLVTLITFIVQAFYARMIWRVSENRIIPIIILVIALAAFALGIVTSEHLFSNPTATSISAPKFSIMSGLVQGLASLDDILITAALCYFLHSRRRGFSNSTEAILDNLILYAVSRGVLTAVTQILFLVLNVALPHDYYWQPFHQAVGKLYVNSVLATLNVRTSFKDETEINLGTRGLEFATGPATTSAGVNELTETKLHFAPQAHSTTSAFESDHSAGILRSKDSTKIEEPSIPS
ncbi:hypothetical protein C8J56DRAFT_943586 [Mycena floridula]|nr:hypothetical protein C8J56DRAFT_943586 [Mycena floridula]